MDKLNFYKLRAKVMAEDLSEVLGVMAVWDGAGETEYGLCYADPRLPALGMRVMLPPHLAARRPADLGAKLVEAEAYEAHRIALGVPRGGMDFSYGDTFPHEADMDQLAGVDFDKGCYVGQEVVSRVEHRSQRAQPHRAGRLRRIRARLRPAGDGGRKGDRHAGLGRQGPRPGDAAARPAGRCAGGRARRSPAAISRSDVVKPDWAKFAWPAAS